MNIQDLRDRNLIIFEGIVGSTAYGTDIKGVSDIDTKGIFIQPLEDILGFGYIEQINDSTNDTVFYELRRYLELLMSNNPNLSELLYLPERCVIYKHPIADMLLEHKDKFISKQSRTVYAAYAYAQISKAHGLNKKIVNPIPKERKTPIDFCYVVDEHNSYSLRDILKQKDMDQLFCGVVNIPNAKGMYALYYDHLAHQCFSKSVPENIRESNKQNLMMSDASMGLGFRGIEKEDLTSNEIRLSSVPKGMECEFIFSYNLDGYTVYCKKYKEYHEWVEKRNQVRFNDNIKHGKSYDTKNMLHSHRLLDMSIEIASGKGIIVERPNREYLLRIRSGEMEYDDLIKEAEEKLKLANELFDKSDLPECIDKEFVDNLLISMRKEFYKL